MQIEPCTLEGHHVRLEPLEEYHVAALCDVGLDPELWRWTSSRVESADGMRGYVRQALAERDGGSALPFVIVDRATDTVIGSTRFGSIAVAHRRVEIGWSWYGRAWQRTAANTETKLLLLTHAFERWECRRVELKTSARNDRSREAILRLGAVQEGILRHHMINPDGTLRDTVYFSVLCEEWPEVRERLRARLARSPR